MWDVRFILESLLISPVLGMKADWGKLAVLKCLESFQLRFSPFFLLIKYCGYLLLFCHTGTVAFYDNNIQGQIQLWRYGRRENFTSLIPSKTYSRPWPWAFICLFSCRGNYIRSIRLNLLARVSSSFYSKVSSNAQTFNCGKWNLLNSFVAAFLDPSYYSRSTHRMYFPFYRVMEKKRAREIMDFSIFELSS